MNTLAGERITESSSQVALCFDSIMTPQFVRETVVSLRDAISSIGKKVERVDAGTTLKINGQWIENSWRNKMILTLKKRGAEEDVFPVHVLNDFEEFFNNLIR